MKPWIADKLLPFMQFSTYDVLLKSLATCLLMMRPFVQAVRHKPAMMQQEFFVYSKLVKAGKQYRPCYIWNSTSTGLLRSISFDEVMVLPRWTCKQPLGITTLPCVARPSSLDFWCADEQHIIESVESCVNRS